jgi:tetratricopeptide (TPR) repeat protein
MKARDVVLIVLLGAAVFVTQRRVDRALDALSRPAPSLWAGREVKRLVPGFEGLFADVYWLRTVQYYGGQRAYVAGSRYELLYPLIDITVTLDPRLELAYRYGATFLAEPRPAGAGEPEKAVAILERGVAAFPDNWRLRQYLGFIVFLFLHDSERAAKILNEAAELPGAASWLRTLAAELLLRGGERQASRAMWTQMYEQGEEGYIKDNARFRLRELDALDQADALTAAAAAIEKRTGRKPAALAEIGGAAKLRVVDPTGVPFEYDAIKGVVTVSPRSSLWRPQVGVKP